MSLFGVAALVAALVHDLAMRQQETDPVFWPWALVALSFWFGLDMVLGAMAEAWEDFIEAKMAAQQEQD